MSKPRTSKKAKAEGVPPVEKKPAAPSPQEKIKLDLDDTATTREEIELPRSLADTEVAFISAQTAEAQFKIDLNEAEIAAYVKPRRKIIAELHKQVSKGSKEVHTKTQHILVQCRVVHDYRLAQVRTYRLDRGDRDIGELIKTVAMPPEEREKAIFSPPPDAPRVEAEELPTE